MLALRFSNAMLGGGGQGDSYWNPLMAAEWVRRADGVDLQDPVVSWLSLGQAQMRVGDSHDLRARGQLTRLRVPAVVVGPDAPYPEPQVPDLESLTPDSLRQWFSEWDEYERLYAAPFWLQQSQLNRLVVVDDPEHLVARWDPFDFWLWGHQCCVESFDYPLKAKDVSGTLPTSYKWRFKFGAVYKEDSSCLCECCVFKQYVRTTFFTIPLNIWTDWWALNVVAKHTSDFREDCNKIDAHKEVVGRFPAGDTEGPGEQTDCYPGLWNQGENFWLPPYEAPDGTTRCSWENRDEPQVDVIPGGYYKLVWEFVGRIHDRCRGDVPVVTKAFTWMASGIVGISEATSNLSGAGSHLVPNEAASSLDHGRPVNIG